MQQPTLYLLPVNISEAPVGDVLPARNIEITTHLRHFIVENVRTARRFLRRCIPGFPIDECTFSELNAHTPTEEISAILEPLRHGESMGLMSEAGCPAVADPGAQVVAIAQRERLHVQPLVGPSSILLALMASGFNGQGFTFNGYLPVKGEERTKKIKELEAISRRTGLTQIFIETPYRNRQMLEELARTLSPSTMVCVASNITDPDQESVVSLPAAQWAHRTIGKYPAIFLIHVPS